jgi:hypothetical protein
MSHDRSQSTRSLQVPLLDKNSEGKNPDCFAKLREEIFSFFLPQPVDEVGQKKQKLSLYLSLTVALSLIGIVCYVLITNIQQYPLIFSHDERLPALPNFYVCFVPTNFPNLRGIAAFIVGNSQNSVFDCTFGTLQSIKTNPQRNSTGCGFIRQVFEQSTGQYCLSITGNDTFWNNVQESTLGLFMMTNSDVLDPNSGWPVVRLTKFFWVDPSHPPNVSTDALSCNLYQIPADGLTLIDFHAELNRSDPRNKGICYVSSNNFVAFQPTQQDRFCRYTAQQLNNNLTSIQNCSDILSLLLDNNGTLQLFYLRMRLQNFVLQVYESESEFGLVLRILGNIGGISQTVIQVLFVIFAVILTRLVIWKRPDAYFSDEIRLAATYFVTKQRQQNLSNENSNLIVD